MSDRQVIASQLWLDIRWFVGILSLVITIYVLRRWLNIYIPIWLIGSALIGSLAGIGVGYYLYRPTTSIALDIKAFPDYLRVFYVPQGHEEELPDGYRYTTSTRLGMPIVIISDSPWLDTIELRANKDALKRLTEQYLEALEQLSELESSLEMKALEKARNLFQLYLEARQKLLMAWQEHPIDRDRKENAYGEGH